MIMKRAKERAMQA